MDKKTKKALSGLFCFWAGAICGLIAFALTYRLIAFIGLSYVWTSIISYALLLVLLVVVADIPSIKETRIRGVFKIFICIFFVLSLLRGHEKKFYPEANPSVVEEVEQEGSEFGTVSSVGEIWRTTRSYKKGTNIIVRIRGTSVRILNGETLEPSDYSIPILSDGTIAFKGISEGTSKIEVIQ